MSPVAQGLRGGSVNHCPRRCSHPHRPPKMGRNLPSVKGALSPPPPVLSLWPVAKPLPLPPGKSCDILGQPLAGVGMEKFVVPEPSEAAVTAALPECGFQEGSARAVL